MIFIQQVLVIFFNKSIKAEDDNLKWVVQFHQNMLKLIDISFHGLVQLIQEYHQTLKSNIRIMQTQIMKEYIFFEVGAIMLYSSFQQSNFILFLPPISAFDAFMHNLQLT